MAQRKSIDDRKEAVQPTFEEALAGLESIVDSMEHENLALEELVARFEKGSELLNRCESILQSARGRIKLITLRNQNEISLDATKKLVEDSETRPSTDLPEDIDEDNDIRLF